MDNYFLGIDVGTQGARVLLVNQHGETKASLARPFVLTGQSREEQSPEVWWQDCKYMIAQILNGLSDTINKSNILAVSVTSTSGTVIPMDANDCPVYHAIMYSDGRSTVQAQKCQALAKEKIPDGYTGFNTSSGLSKMVWFVESYPARRKEIYRWIHASDYIVGQLSGRYDVTDYTNALKSGYDLVRLEWPAYLWTLGLERQWMQEVVPSGTVVGELLPALCEEWGLPPLKVVVGMTDGCASQVASGAVNPGDWNTTIGTTLVIKGVTKNMLLDREGRLYSHRHPEGYWMPGGASNTGADWISMDYASDVEKLNRTAAMHIPTGLLAWPLKQSGERFPIMNKNIKGFAPQGVEREILFAANLEGVAFVERLAYEIIQELSGENVNEVYTAGGGSKSAVWLHIRASVMGVPMHTCKEASGALGAAIMAASNTYYGSLQEAAARMTSRMETVLPDPVLVDAYEEQYQLFKKKLKELNYM